MICLRTLASVHLQQNIVKWGRDFAKENLEPVSIYITQKQYDLTIHVFTREFPNYFFGNAEN